MGEVTGISWCDHTWNPWIGCTKVSPACDHCYAEALMDTRYHKARWGAGNPRARTSASTWNDPRRWNKKAAAAGEVRFVFTASLSDFWDNEADPSWRREALEVMASTPWLVYLVLSKRIGNAVKMVMPAVSNPLGVLPRNVALGSTMINQEEYDRDAPKLADAAERLGALFTFASIEPMLGRMDVRAHTPDWLIVGGESGNGAREMLPGWARSIRDQAAEMNKPFLFKQGGDAWGNGKHHGGDLLNGQRYQARPDVLAYRNRVIGAAL